MPSLLQACVGLLIVSCVHGFWAPYEDLIKCARPEFINSCASRLYTTVGVTSQSEILHSSMDRFCNNQDAFVTYTGCVQAEYQQCLPQDMHGLIQTPSRTRDALQFLCSHRNEINITCTQQTFERTFLFPGCPRSTPGNSGIVQDLISKSCRYFDDTSRCYVRAGLDCSNHRVCVFDEAFRKSYPPACGVAGLGFSTSALLLGACAVLLNNMAALI